MLINNDLEEVYINNPSYNSTEYITEWYESSAIIQYVFTVYCSSNCDISIEYATNNEFNVIDSEIKTLVSNTTQILLSSLRTKYVRFKIFNISFQPSHLICQVLYSK